MYLLNGTYFKSRSLFASLEMALNVRAFYNVEKVLRVFCTKFFQKSKSIFLFPGLNLSCSKMTSRMHTFLIHGKSSNAGYSIVCIEVLINDRLHWFILAMCKKYASINHAPISGMFMYWHLIFRLQLSFGSRIVDKVIW